MIPTVDAVVAEIQSLLGDEPARVFTNAVAYKGFARAYRRLRDEMIKRQIPRVIRVATYTLPANTLSVTPATMLLTNFGELIEIAERLPGSSDDYAPLEEATVGTGPVSEVLGAFEWREDGFYFYGATGNRELRVRYYDSGEPPALGESVGIDNSFAFLSVYGAAAVGPSKGYDDSEIQRMREEALDHLNNLLVPMTRAFGRVQLQPRPYSAGGYTLRRVRRPLYIPAPPTP